MEDLCLTDIPHLGVRWILDFARSLGVRVVDLGSLDLPGEVSYEPVIQKWMKKHHKASRCPVDVDMDGEPGVFMFTRFGNPVKRQRGSLFVPVLDEWRVFPLPPEAVLVHEIAHALLGREENTCLWETEAVRALFGVSSARGSVWSGLSDYQNGASCGGDDPARTSTMLRRLATWGALPIRYPGVGVQLELPF